MRASHTTQLWSDPLLVDSLDRERGNAVSTRSVRFAALKSFFRYLERRVPACFERAGQVHLIPAKRGGEPLVDYLSRDEMQTLLDAPDARTASGVRDPAMPHLAYAAGLRVSELIGLMTGDLRQWHYVGVANCQVFVPGPYILCLQRVTIP